MVEFTLLLPPYRYFPQNIIDKRLTFPEHNNIVSKIYGILTCWEAK